MKTLRVIITLGFCVCAPGASTVSARDGGFSVLIYPPPRSFPNWGLLGGCPSLKGLRLYERSGEGAARTVLLRFGRDSLLSDLRNSDRALWQTIAVDWAQRGLSKRPRNPPIVSHSGTGASAPDARLIRANCGDRILQASTWFSTCPPQTSASCYPALRGQFLLLNRRGRWLVWFQA